MEIYENNLNLNFLFRNRLALIQKNIIEKRGLDAILIILSYDSLNSVNILKLSNWLLFGHSSSIELEEKVLNFNFNETFLIISKDSVYVFSQNETKEFFYHLFSKVSNVKVEFDFTTKKEESNSEFIQLLKIAKFLEKVRNLKKIGVPLLNREKNNILEIEKWPLISAFGLDILGEGFFTLKHEIVDISQDLEKLYHIIDISACNNLIYSKAYKLETILSDFFTLFDRESLDKRLNRSEMYLNENQELELLILNYNELKKTKFGYLNDLPDPRILVGINTDKNFEEGSSAEPLYKIYFDYKIPSFHMTYENFDAITGIRFGRTFFLSNLQKEYLNHNEDQELKYESSKYYDESFFIFQIYHKLVKFLRLNQNRLITENLTQFKNILSEEINEFIKTEYNKDENNYNYFLNSDNIIINKNEYQITQKSENFNQNKIIVLRLEIKEIVSVHSNRKLGSVLICDSFLNSHNEIFALTNDIIPFKFFYTSSIHLTGNEEMNYDIIQLLKAESKLKFSEIEIKGLIFYENQFNIPYLFIDDIDNNEMCLSLNGKLIIFENYLVIYDNSIGYFVIDNSNVEELLIKDEIKYSVLIFKIKELNKLPLSGILKNEILIYLPTPSERMKTIKYDLISYLKLRNYKIKSFNSSKEDEYQIAISTLNHNPYDNLNYISNSFNLTNIYDVISDMYEYEYICLNLKNDLIISYPEFKKLKENLICEDTHNKINIIFLFGTILDNMKSFTNSIEDLGKSLGIKSKVVFPNLSLINNKKEFYKFYLNQLEDFSNSNLKNKNKILILSIFNEIPILEFLSEIFDLFDIDKFFNEFNILNISYVINYNNFIKNKHKNLSQNLYNILYEDLINFIFVDEGYLSTDKIERNNKIIQSMNSKATIFNMRSFKNIKEMKIIFESKNVNKNIFNFYKEFYPKKANSNLEEIFIKLKFGLRRYLLENFMRKFLNIPLKYAMNKNVKFDEMLFDDNGNYKNLSDSDFQIALAEMVKEVKNREIEIIIEKIVGNVKFLKNKEIENNDDNIFSIIASYKEKKIEINNESNSDNEIGLFISGQNIHKNLNYLNEIIISLSGEIPQFKNDRTKEDLSEEEIFNLNLVNFFRDLPEGWYWDGPVILDPEDNRYGQHPDLDLFIKEYLVICNQAVEEHNKKILQELKEFYYI